jgi:citrate lyase synthetase
MIFSFAVAYNNEIRNALQTDSTATDKIHVIKIHRYKCHNMMAFQSKNVKRFEKNYICKK